MLRACDLKQKEVINICDASRLGYVCDVELDFASGCIKAVILPERFRFFPFIQKNKNRVIPWENIVRVGEDILLVNIPDFINASDNISREER